MDVCAARPSERASRSPKAIITLARTNTYYCHRRLITPSAQMNKGLASESEAEQPSVFLKRSSGDSF